MRALLALPLALIVAASTAAADPVLRCTWGPADGLILNQDFNGPQTYTQTLSVTGLSGSIREFRVAFFLGRYRPPGSAWEAILPPSGFPGQTVLAPRPDCEGGPGFSATTTVAGATAISGATVIVSHNATHAVTSPYIYTTMGVTVTIDPPFVADPSVRYGIATLEYHHQNSVVGVSPDACDGAEEPMCWMIYDATASFSVGGSVSLWQESPLLSWQNASGATNCLSAVTPTRKSSWGSIKTLYR